MSEPVVTVERCACGLHVMDPRIDRVSWYWALHGRDRCTLQLPDERCWCGRRRSQHQNSQGHAADGEWSLASVLSRLTAEERASIKASLCGTNATMFEELFDRFAAFVRDDK